MDSHLPAVCAQRLAPEALRARFEPTLSARFQASDGRAPWLPEFVGDGLPLGARALRQAAVLVPLVCRDSGLTVLLTRRADHLSHHAGQISFPGGRTDPQDANAIATALREAQEEVGLRSDEVEVVGRLPAYTTVTGYEVTPIIGLVPVPPQGLRVDESEVAEVFEVPLAFLMNPAHHRHHAFRTPTAARGFISMPWRPNPAADEYFIWGATAAIVRNFYAFLMS